MCADDKRLQNTLKRLGVNTIPGIEEVNLFKVRSPHGAAHVDLDSGHHVTAATAAAAAAAAAAGQWKRDPLQQP